MKNKLLIPIVFSLAWIGYKLVTFGLQVLQNPEDLFLSVMINIFCLLATVTFSLYFYKKTEDQSGSSALGDMKKGMSAGMIYTLIVGVFIYVYYQKIDPSFNENRIAIADREIAKDVSNPVKLKAYKAHNPELQSKTEDEIVEQLKKGPRMMFSASFTSTISFLALTVLTTLNSIIVTAILRRFIFRTSN
jgi:hypothetical protein